ARLVPARGPLDLSPSRARRAEPEERARALPCPARGLGLPGEARGRGALARRLSRGDARLLARAPLDALGPGARARLGELRGVPGCARAQGARELRATRARKREGGATIAPPSPFLRRLDRAR